MIAINQLFTMIVTGKQMNKQHGLLGSHKQQPDYGYSRKPLPHFLQLIPNHGFWGWEPCGREIGKGESQVGILTQKPFYKCLRQLCYYWPCFWARDSSESTLSPPHPQESHGNHDKRLPQGTVPQVTEAGDRISLQTPEDVITGFTRMKEAPTACYLYLYCFN